MSAYWELATPGVPTRTYTALSIQCELMRIVGRSKGGGRMLCCDASERHFLFCLLGGGWSPVGGALRIPRFAHLSPFHHFSSALRASDLRNSSPQLPPSAPFA